MNQVNMRHIKNILKHYLRSLAQCGRIFNDVPYKPSAINFDEPEKIVCNEQEMSRVGENEELDLLKLKSQLNARIKMQNTALIYINLHGFRVPIFLN